MKTKITKKAKQELKSIIDSFGYWSDETRKFIEQFDFVSSRKLHNMAQVYSKYGYGMEG